MVDEIPAPLDYYDRVCAIFDLTKDEKYYQERLPEMTPPRFAWFAIGYKLRKRESDEKNWKPLAPEELAERLNEMYDDVDEIDEIVLEGKAAQDPRLDPENFKIGPIVKAYGLEEGADAFDHWRLILYSYGRRLSNPEDRDGDEAEQRIEEDWINYGNFGGIVNTFLLRGSLWYDRFYMQQMELLYTLSEEEREYCKDFDELAQEDFRAYAQGFKEECWGKDHWSEWTDIGLEVYIDLFTERFQVEKYLRLAEQNQDPRLNDANFEFTAFTRAFYKSLAPVDKADFEKFTWGKKVSTPLLGNDGRLTDTIRREWASGASVPRDEYIQIGTEWLARYQERAPRPGRAGGHLYGDGEKLPATRDDITEVNRARGQSGSRWKFERTVYVNPNQANPNVTYTRTIHLFVRVDEYGVSHERIAVKIQGEDSAAMVNAVVGEEFRLQYMVNQIGSPYILELYGMSVRPRNTPPRALGYLYMEWAPWGDLYDFFEKAKKNLAPGETLKQFPEPLLWYIFRALAETLHVMYTGQLVLWNAPPRAQRALANSALPRAVGWSEMVNPDIKINNVVLGHAQNASYPSYKTLKLIDFGIAFNDNRYHNLRSKQLTTRPDTWRGIGTPGCRPPEQFNPPGRSLKGQPIDVQSHVWNIGHIMFQLTEQKFVDANENNYKFVHTVEYRDKHRYFPALDDLIQRCVTYDPRNRPQLNAILYETRKGLEDWENTYQSADVDELPACFTWPWEEEQFPIGKQAPKHWRWATKKRPRDDDDNDDEDDGEDPGPSGDKAKRRKSGKTLTGSAKGKGPASAKSPKEKTTSLDSYIDEEDEPIAVASPGKRTRRIMSPLSNPAQAKGKGKAIVKSPTHKSKSKKNDGTVLGGHILDSLRSNRRKPTPSPRLDTGKGKGKGKGSVKSPATVEALATVKSPTVQSNSRKKAASSAGGHVPEASPSKRTRRIMSPLSDAGPSKTWKAKSKAKTPSPLSHAGPSKTSTTKSKAKTPSPLSDAGLSKTKSKAKTPSPDLPDHEDSNSDPTPSPPPAARTRSKK